MKHSGTKVQDLKHRLQENKNIEDLLNAKIGTLELNSKHKEQVLQELQKEYDLLCKDNKIFKSAKY